MQGIRGQGVTQRRKSAWRRMMAMRWGFQTEFPVGKSLPIPCIRCPPLASQSLPHSPTLRFVAMEETDDAAARRPGKRTTSASDHASSSKWYTDSACSAAARGFVTRILARRPPPTTRCGAVTVGGYFCDRISGRWSAGRTWHPRWKCCRWCRRRFGGGGGGGRLGIRGPVRRRHRGGRV